MERSHVQEKLESLRSKLPDDAQRHAFTLVINKLLEEFDNPREFEFSAGPLDVEGYKRVLFDPTPEDAGVYVDVLETSGEGEMGNALVPFMVM